MSIFGRNYVKISKDDSTELQYSNAIKKIFHEIRVNGINEILSELPTSENEEFLADKIFKRILSMKTRPKLQRECLTQFFAVFNSNVCINCLNPEIKNANQHTFILFLESTPNSILKTELTKSLLDEVMVVFLDNSSILKTYLRYCDVNQAMLFDYLENSNIGSSVSLSAIIKYVATNCMDDGAKFLPKFISSRSDESSYFSFKAILHLNKVNQYMNELLDYGLTIGSRHFEEYSEVMNSIKLSDTNEGEFIGKFEFILNKQIERLENCVEKAKKLRSKRLESLIRREFIPMIKRYRFLEDVANRCACKVKLEFESYDVLSKRINAKVLPFLARSKSYHLIKKFITMFDDDSLISILDYHSTWRGMDTSIRKILSEEGEVVDRMLGTLYSSFKKEKSADRKDDLRNHLLRLTAIAELEIAFYYVEKLMNYESVTVDMLVKSTKKAVKNKTDEPEHRLYIGDHLECLKRKDSTNRRLSPTRRLFDLVEKYNEISDGLRKYGILIILFNQGYINIQGFWDEINKMNPSVIFRTEFNHSKEIVKTFRGFNWFSTWSHRMRGLFYPILTKEIEVSNEIYNSLINSLKNDNGRYFDFSVFSESEVKSVYQKLVDVKTAKSSKEFGRWFVARNKHGLKILIEKVNTSNYHAAEQLIELGMDHSIEKALEKFRQIGQISIDFKLFIKKMQRRIDCKSPGYYHALEWMLAIPNKESFEFIDKMCQERKIESIWCIGGSYTGQITINYKTVISLVQKYLKNHKNNDSLGVNPQIQQGIDDFVSFFSKYDPSVIGHYW